MFPSFTSSYLWISSSLYNITLDFVTLHTIWFVGIVHIDRIEKIILGLNLFFIHLAVLGKYLGRTLIVDSTILMLVICRAVCFGRRSGAIVCWFLHLYL